MKPETLPALAVVAVCLTSCVTSKTTTTYPDGRIEVIDLRAPATESIANLSSAAASIALASIDSDSGK